MKDAPTRTPKAFGKPKDAPTSFDVTCTIGTVELFRGDGDLSPSDAAFLLISRHGADGTFKFPCPNGDVISVTVETSHTVDSRDRTDQFDELL